MSAAGKKISGNLIPNDRKPGDFTYNLLNCIKEGQELVLSSLKKVASTTESNVCYVCDKLFLSKGDLVMHLKLIHNACATADCKNISDFRMHSSVCANRGFGCTICNMKFTDKVMLLMHFNEHIGAAFYACDICRDGFQQRKDLQRHLLEVHQKKTCVPVIPSHSKPVYQKCGQCSKYYRLFAEFEEHTSSCSDSSGYDCAICLISFTTFSELQEHKLAEHKRDEALKGSMALKCGKQYFCGVCYLGFTKGSICKLHLATHVTEENFVCDVCHSRFTNDDDLQTHYLLHIEEHYVLHDVISQYSCKSCKKTFKTPGELNIHSAECVTCKSEPPEISSPTKDSLDKKDHSECGTENSSNASKDETLVDASLVDITDILIYALKSGDDLMNCDDKQCIIVMDLQSVFVLQRGECAAENRMPEVKDSIAYEENDAIDTSELQNHMFQILKPTDDCSDGTLGTQIDSENVQCLVQNFDTESGGIESLDVNFEESVDGSQQNIIINDKICSVLVSSVDDSLNIENALNSDNNYVKSNTENVQENFVPYYNDNTMSDEISNVQLLPESSADVLNDMHVCNICNQVFSTKNSLCLHMKGSHTGFDCYRCGNSFKSEEDLKSHEKASHPSAFNCDLCEVSYDKEHLLRKHKHSAHGGKNFVCNICNKSYVLRNELDVHLMLHRGETPPTKCEHCGKIFASVNNYLRHKLIHEGKSIPKKYKCTVCDKSFIAKTPLQRHMSTHIRKSPLTYECPKCKMYFTSKQLAEHVESHDVS